MTTPCLHVWGDHKHVTIARHQSCIHRYMIRDHEVPGNRVPRVSCLLSPEDCMRCVHCAPPYGRFSGWPFMHAASWYPHFFAVTNSQP